MIYLFVYEHACVCCACVRVSVHACMHMCMQVCVCVFVCGNLYSNWWRDKSTYTYVVAFSQLEMSICIYTTIDLSGQTQIFSRNKAPLKAAVNQLNGRLVGLPFCPPVCLIYLMSTLFWAADPKGTMSFRAGGISVHLSVRANECSNIRPSRPLRVQPPQPSP